MSPPVFLLRYGSPLVSPVEICSVFLQAEHITLPRRLLRLPARSLLVGRATWKRGGRDPVAADTLILRLCGVEATAQGIAEARGALTRSTPAVQYCDAELVFQEKRRLLVAGTGVGAREDAEVG